MLDIAHFRGPDLVADLRARDFTINALAIPATARTQAAIIDPTGGLQDLDARQIRIIEAGALTSDPVRTLRAVRLASSLEFTLTEETRIAVIAAGPLLADISAERKRDEFVKILMTGQPDNGMREMEALGLLEMVLPEIARLSGIAQSPPHYEDVMAHTWSVLSWLVRLETVFYMGSKQDSALKDACAALNAYLDRLNVYLRRPVDGGLDGHVVLRLAALFHDVGKGETSQEEDGRIRFIGHDKIGAKIAGQRLRGLSLSNDAIKQVKTIVAGHMRPLSLAQAQGARPSRRAVFRYFRVLGDNGLDVAILAMADHLATYDGLGDQEAWDKLVGLVAELFRFYFEQHEETVKPVPLLSGQDLIDILEMVPGPEIGRILRLIEEGQAAGEIRTRAEALQFAQEQIL
jgi:putative nucleotidyltransferase with HDIG domain